MRHYVYKYCQRRRPPRLGGELSQVALDRLEGTLVQRQNGEDFVVTDLGWILLKILAFESLVLELWPAACFVHAPTANHQERSEAVSNSIGFCMTFPPCHNLQSGIGPRRGRRAAFAHNSTKIQIKQNSPYFYP